MRSMGLAVSSFLGIFVWLAFAYVLLVGSSLGDGNTGMPVAQARVLLIPLTYLAILFLCSFRFVTGVLLAVGEILAMVTLVIFAIGAFAFGWWGFLLWLPLIPYAIASRRLFHVKPKTK